MAGLVAVGMLHRITYRLDCLLYTSGTVLASLGLIIAILGFDEAGTALLLTIFALQDSFGTACNVTGDGALTLITDTFDQGQTGKASTAL